MKTRNIVLLLCSHFGAGALGVALGIYLLPILIAPESPSEAALVQSAKQATYTGQFTRALKGSDAFHWGEGEVFVGRDFVSLKGSLAPGPDYKLYLSPVFVENEEEFMQQQSRMLKVGDVKTFENFMLSLPAGVDPAQYSSLIVWCETFGEFITAARYR